MNAMIIVIFAISLIYLSITERFRIYAGLIGFQGLLLFVLSFIELNTITLATLIMCSISDIFRVTM